MHMKKIFSLALLLTTLTASMASASVQTGSIQKVNLDLKYPLVYTQNQTAQKKINQDIATWVYDSKKGYDTGEFYSVETQYEVTYEDDSVISLELINLSYPAGAAHEWVSYDCIVYNKKTGLLCTTMYASEMQTSWKPEYYPWYSPCTTSLMKKWNMIPKTGRSTGYPRIISSVEAEPSTWFISHMNWGHSPMALSASVLALRLSTTSTV